MKCLRLVGNKLNLMIVLNGLLLILDRLTKILALVGVLRISKNKNLFFFDMKQSWLIVFAVFIIIVLFLQIIKAKQNKSKLEFLGYLLIILGGLSNLFDRVVYGYVVDMLHLFSFSVFNLADVMIMVGCILIFSLTFLKSKTRIEDVKN